MSTLRREVPVTGAVDRATKIISADSHVHEPPDVWLRVPEEYREQASQIGQQSDIAAGKPGGSDPNERVKEMEVDGVSAEVLYPTTGIRLFDVDDARYQEALYRGYNDWLAEYCSVAPNRLIGIPLISLYDVDNAVKELERCRKMGLQGALIWLAPPDELPFSSSHYERFWAAAQDLNAPVNLHISLHLKSHPMFQIHPNERIKQNINHRQKDAADSLFDLIAYGALDRYPRLKFVLVELQIGWIPFNLQQWDMSFGRGKKIAPEDLPSRKFERQVYATFIDDDIGCKLLSWWGQDNCMWSSDYPHPASTWPHSREAIARQLGHLDEATRKKIVHDNVVRLYSEVLHSPEV